MTIVAMEIPYPPVHGGRVDIWRRIKALHRAGVRLQLVAWSYKLPEIEESSVIQEYVDDFYPLVYERTLDSFIHRAINLVSYPLEVTSRIMRGKARENLLSAVRAFQPNVIFADHIHTGVTAQQLSQDLDTPFVVRSHDVEHLHYQYMFKSATGLKKLMRLLSLNHLKAYETSVLEQSLAFYDISIDDLQFWREQGLTNGYWLPPLIEFPQEEPNGNSGSGDRNKPPYDAIFLGNLIADNNVAGVIWFLKQVVPLLTSKKPDIKILIAGSNPVQQIKSLCSQIENVDLVINPPSAADIYQMGQVFINPISVGSGVSIKSIDMLAIGKPIVTLPKGLFGLPEEAKQFFRVAFDAESFANEILLALTQDQTKAPDKNLLDALFGPSVVQRFVTDLNAQLVQNSKDELLGVSRN